MKSDTKPQTRNYLDDAPILYTREDIMSIMKISQTIAYKLFNSDAFPSIKIGGSYRIEKTEFEKWLKEYAGKEFLL